MLTHHLRQRLPKTHSTCGDASLPASTPLIGISALLMAAPSHSLMIREMCLSLSHLSLPTQDKHRRMSYSFSLCNHHNIFLRFATSTRGSIKPAIFRQKPHGRNT